MKILALRSSVRIASIVLLSFTTGGHLLSAAPITLVSGSVNMFRDIRAANDVGIAQGDVFQFGANIVGGSTGTTLGAFYAPDGFTVGQTACQPLAVDPNFCARSTKSANILGNPPTNTTTRFQPWTLTFQNGANNLQVLGPSLAGTDSTVPFPANVTISGSGPTRQFHGPFPTALSQTAFESKSSTETRFSPTAQRISSNPPICSQQQRHIRSLLACSNLTGSTRSICRSSRQG